MYRFRREGVSVITVLDTRHKKKNGLYPVKIEVIFRRKQKYFPTGIDVSEKEWSAIWTMHRKSEKASYVEKVYSRIRNEANRLIDRGEFSLLRLEAHLGNVKKTVNDAIKSKMDSARKNGKINTFYRYRTTLRALERFSGLSISFDSVTTQWLSRCEAFWIMEGKSTTTINIYMRVLKCVFNEIINDGYMMKDDYPFAPGKYRIPASRTRDMALTRDEILSIRNWKGDEECEYWRDLWLFSYMCNGINFRDMLFLRRSCIVNGEITFVRSKTSSSNKFPKIIKAPLLQEMSNIIERHGNGISGPSDGMLFRFAKGTETPQEIINIVRNAISSCNAAMKVIADDIGIRHVSTYSARHSYATILMKSGVNISFISQSLGHSSIHMTEVYLGCYDKEERICNARKLLDI